MLSISDEYTKIASNLLKLPEFEEVKPFASFAMLASDQEKKQNKRTIFGQCILVADNYKWCCPYDFMIIINDPNIEGFSQKQLVTLIRHELHHMGYDATGNEPKPYIVPHDVEDFDIIIKECGLHWEESSKGE